MSPSHGSKGSRQHRYYVSQAILQGRQQEAGSISRLPAPDLEKVVTEAVLTRLTEDPATRIMAITIREAPEREKHNSLRQIIRRVEVAKDIVRVDIEPLGSMAAKPDHDEEETHQPKLFRLELPYKTVSSKGSIRIVPANSSTASFGPDASLITALAKGYAWREQLLSGQVRMITEIARREGLTDRYVNRVLRLGFLAPDIMEAILDGKQPAKLTMETFRKTIPLDWAEQRKLFGFGA